MGRRVVSGGCHLTERKNDDFAALWRLSPDGKELDGGGVHGASSSGPRSKRRLFIASIPFSRVYNHSLPHSRLATSDVEGE
ncbi:unnamed protein product [Spirodela intermedia]|uniref:Uncharacterized protein n=1 Tax=Spirodela intermedia TaxID=51605 RepID=A0A7I8JKM7_SPIIN|nr:unnamed protein product [Spirodela intermedia]CAA6670737.1 unnamed protein product [Spirodela intermedia]